MMSTSKKISSVTRLIAPLLTRNGALIALIFCSSGAGLLTWADRSISSQVQRNSTIALFLSTELKRESSADLAGARGIQAELIKSSIMEMQIPSIRLIGLLHPKYSPVTQMTPALDVLVGSEKVQFTDSEALKRSQAILEQAGKSWFLDDKPAVSVWSYSSDHRLQMAKDIQNTFNQSVEQFNNEPSFASAEWACLNSRFAATAFLTAWIDYSPVMRKVKSKQFADQLSNLHDKMLKVAANLPASDQKRLSLYAENVRARAHFFECLNSGGIQAGRKHLLVDLAQR